MATSKGGPRRKKTEDIDGMHLVDILAEVVRKEGCDQAFTFHIYTNLSKQQAIQGMDLAKQLPLVTLLSTVCPSLMFKYSDLKQAFSSILTTYPALRSRFPAEKQAALAGSLSESVMTILTHCRRLLVDTKLREASKNLPEYYASKLLELKKLAQAGENDDGPSCAQQDSQRVVEGNGGKEDKRKAEAPSSSSQPSKREAWQAILDMEVPQTQDDTSSCSALKDAEAVSPVPPRKKDIRELMKKPAAHTDVSAQPEKATKGQTQKVTKGKPATKASQPKTMLKKQGVVKKTSSGVNYHLMSYKATQAVAIRVRGGKQVLQIKKKGNDLAGNTKLAQQLLDALVAGKSLEEVLEMKESLLKK